MKQRTSMKPVTDAELRKSVVRVTMVWDRWVRLCSACKPPRTTVAICEAAAAYGKSQKGLFRLGNRLLVEIRERPKPRRAKGKVKR